MKTFKSGGMKFYMLAPGDLYPDPYADNQYIGAYVIFLHDGKWYVQIHTRNRWENLTDESFERENTAFNFAYDHYIEAEKKKYPQTR